MLTLGKFNDIKLRCREEQQEPQRRQQEHQHHQQEAQQQRRKYKMLPTLLSAFCVFIFAMTALQVTAAEEEGDSCSMKSIQGQCMAASKCYDRIDHYIREGLLKQDEIKSCGLGPREEIICCPLKVISTVATPPTITTRPITTTTTARPTQIAGSGQSLDASATHFDFQDFLGSNIASKKPQVDQNVGSIGQAVQSGRGFGMPQVTPSDHFGDNSITNKGFMINNDNHEPSFDSNVPLNNVAFDQTNNNRLRMPTNVGRTQFLPPGQSRNQPRDRQSGGRLIVNGPMMSGERHRKPERWGELPPQIQQQAPTTWLTQPSQQQQQQQLNPTILWPTNNQQTQLPQQHQQTDFDPIDYVNKNMINSGFDIVKADLVPNPSMPSTPNVWNINVAPVESETTTVNTNWDSDPFAPFKFQGKPIDEINDNNIALDTNNGGGVGGSGSGSAQISDVSNTNANFVFPSPAGVQPTDSSTPSIVRSNKRASEEACSVFNKDLTRTLTQHILDGTAVNSGEYPHMAAIAYPAIDATSNYTFRCGGTLIDKRFVLTAAHCVVDDELQPQFVRLGVVSLEQNLGNDGRDVGVARVHIHQNYSQSLKYNDIALLELAEEVKFSDFIRPTCLYTELNDPPSSYEYYVAGWGTINQKTRLKSKILLKARLHIVPLTFCNDSVAVASGGAHRQLMNGLQQTQMCAADPGGTKDACTGDSGGPLLMINDPTVKLYHVVGVISVGFGCASSTPGLYTRVASYLDYIESIVWPDQ